MQDFVHQPFLASARKYNSHPKPSIQTMSPGEAKMRRFKGSHQEAEPCVVFFSYKPKGSSVPT